MIAPDNEEEEPNTEGILEDYAQTCETEHKRKARPSEEVTDIDRHGVGNREKFGDHIKKLRRL